MNDKIATAFLIALGGALVVGMFRKKSGREIGCEKDVQIPRRRNGSGPRLSASSSLVGRRTAITGWLARAIAVMAGGLSLAACSFATPSMDFFSSKPATASLSIESNSARRRRAALNRGHLPHALLGDRAACERVLRHRRAQWLHAGNQDGAPGLGRGQRGQSRRDRTARSQSAVRRAQADGPAKAAPGEEEAQAPDPGGSARRRARRGSAAPRRPAGIWASPQRLRTAPRSDQVARASPSPTAADFGKGRGPIICPSTLHLIRVMVGRGEATCFGPA
jgi:hypothetical protein